MKEWCLENPGYTLIIMYFVFTSICFCVKKICNRNQPKDTDDE